MGAITETPGFLEGVSTSPQPADWLGHLLQLGLPEDSRRPGPAHRRQRKPLPGCADQSRV